MSSSKIKRVEKLIKPKKMKNTYKLLSGLFLLTITLYSCSSESDETPELNALEAELQLENKGVLQIESSTYIFKTTGETAKFNNITRDFEFSFQDDLNYTVEISEGKHEGEEATVTNIETGEYIVFSDFHELKNDRIEFDLELSTGQTFETVTYKYDRSDIDDSKWHIPFAIAVSPSVIEAAVQHHGLPADCKAAIVSCAQSGGKPTVTFNAAKGWFAERTCNVECN